jgi:hypothetical protein
MDANPGSRHAAPPFRPFNLAAVLESARSNAWKAAVVRWRNSRNFWQCTGRRGKRTRMTDAVSGQPMINPHPVIAYEGADSQILEQEN